LGAEGSRMMSNDVETQEYLKYILEVWGEGWGGGRRVEKSILRKEEL